MPGPIGSARLEVERLIPPPAAPGDGARRALNPYPRGVSGGSRQLAVWLLSRRGAIEKAMAARLGRRPAAASPEAEILRRFRSFVLLSLQNGKAEPALDGLRADYPRAARALHAWVDAAVDTSGPSAPEVRDALEPLREKFQLGLRSTARSRRASGAPRPNQRRAVSAAIDRVAEAFLAIDSDSGTIEDANPAAGALLGTARDQLLGAEAVAFVPKEERETWWTELEAIAEGEDNRRFSTSLSDGRGGRVPVEASVTRFSTRRRTLALVMARPAAPARR